MRNTVSTAEFGPGSPRTPQRLAGRRLLVIGGGQQTYDLPEPPIGIGRAICELAALEGADVAVADIDAAAAQLTIDSITECGGAAHLVQGDASEPEAATRILCAAADCLGGLDALVLNTGIAAGNKLTGTTPADWDRVMAVNVRAHFLALQAALNILEPRSAITITSSTAARAVTTSDLPAYITSKAALEGLALAAAKEYAPRQIRVNIVMPGLIDTSLGQLASLIKPERNEIPIPLQRQGTAWDVAEAHIFLLSRRGVHHRHHAPGRRRTQQHPLTRPPTSTSPEPERSRGDLTGTTRPRPSTRQDRPTSSHNACAASPADCPLPPARSHATNEGNVARRGTSQLTKGMWSRNHETGACSATALIALAAHPGRVPRSWASSIARNVPAFTASSIVS